MSQIVRMYNVEDIGPVVPVASVGRVLRELQRDGVTLDALVDVIDAFSEAGAEVANLRPVRLAPTVPGGGVVPGIATI